MDEQIAVYYAVDAFKEAIGSSTDPAEFIPAFLMELSKHKRNYKKLYYNQESYGVGTFNEIEFKMSKITKDKGIDLTQRDKNVLAFRIYPEPAGTRYFANDIQTETDIEQLFDYCQVLETAINNSGWEYLINRFGYDVISRLIIKMVGVIDY